MLTNRFFHAVSCALAVATLAACTADTDPPKEDEAISKSEDALAAGCSMREIRAGQGA